MAGQRTETAADCSVWRENTRKHHAPYRPIALGKGLPDAIAGRPDSSTQKTLQCAKPRITGGTLTSDPKQDLYALRDPVRIGKHRFQQHGMIRHRHILDRESIDRRVERPERVLRDRRGNLGAEASR